MKDLTAILQRYRKDMPDSSATAQAIDRGAPLGEISQAALEENLNELTQILLEAQQEEMRGQSEHETDLDTFLRDKLRDLRNRLPNDSKTAQAIDRGAPWGEISACAQEEGLSEISATLFEAERQKVLGSAI